MLDRRAFLGSLAAVASSSAIGCTREAGVDGRVRVGFLANLTHAPMVSALASGRLAKALPGIEIEVRTFRAGPRVCEALLGAAIDVAVTGPGPLVAMHARHAGAPLRVVSGLASGGISFVTLESIERPEDLAGKQVATVQVGSTQDVSLRRWLAKHGLRTKDQGGDVAVHALAPANVQEEMRRHAIAGAWMQEPWATKLVTELGAKRLVDERDLWPGRRFPTALLVARRGFLAARKGEVEAIVAAVAREIEWVRSEPVAAKDLVFAELKRLTHKGLPRPILDEAWERVEHTTDPIADAIAQMAVDARALGFVPRADVTGLVTPAT